MSFICAGNSFRHALSLSSATGSAEVQKNGTKAAKFPVTTMSSVSGNNFNSTNCQIELSQQTTRPPPGNHAPLAGSGDNSTLALASGGSSIIVGGGGGCTTPIKSTALRHQHHNMKLVADPSDQDDTDPDVIPNQYGKNYWTLQYLQGLRSHDSCVPIIDPV